MDWSPAPAKRGARPARLRRAPLISCWNARVRHLPSDGEDRREAQLSRCGKWAFFKPPGLRYVPHPLPVCRACEEG